MHLQLAEAFPATAVGVRDEGAHRDSASHGGGESLRHLGAIEPEDQQIH
jgi:hypothetical protein